MSFTVSPTRIAHQTCAHPKQPRLSFTLMIKVWGERRALRVLTNLALQIWAYRLHKSPKRPHAQSGTSHITAYKSGSPDVNDNLMRKHEYWRWFSLYYGKSAPILDTREFRRP